MIEVACPCNAGSQAVQLTPRPQACGPPPLELVQLRGVSLKGRKGRHLLVSLVSLRSSSWNLSRATPACTAAMSLHTGGLKCGLLEGLTIPGPILQLHGAPQPRQPPSGGGLLAAVACFRRLSTWLRWNGPLQIQVREWFASLIPRRFAHRQIALGAAASRLESRIKTALSTLRCFDLSQQPPGKSCKHEHLTQLCPACLRRSAGAAFSEAATTGFHFPCKLRLRLTSSKASKSKCRRGACNQGESRRAA